jgi:hypothetical protein
MESVYVFKIRESERKMRTVITLGSNFEEALGKAHPFLDEYIEDVAATQQMVDLVRKFLEKEKVDVLSISTPDLRVSA